MTGGSYVGSTYWPNTNWQTWSYPTYDYLGSRVAAICDALEAKAITRAEARKMLCEIDMAFKKIIG